VAALAVLRLALLLAVVLAAAVDARMARVPFPVAVAAVALAGVVQVIVAAEVEAAAPVSPDWVAQHLVTVQDLGAAEVEVALWFAGAAAVLAAVSLTVSMIGCAPETAKM
jgi:hypothetical protein